MQYYGGCLVLWRMFSNAGDIISTTGDTISTLEGAQYCGGYHQYYGGFSALCRMFCAVEDAQHCVGCSALWRMLITV